jgi:hypothetical protein
MNRNHSLLYLGGFLFIFSLLTWLYIFHDRRQEVVVSQLPFTIDAPRQWPIAYHAEKDAPGAEFSASQEMRMQWTRNGEHGNPPVISVNGFVYSTPGRAWIHYFLSQPEIAYYNDWPNFTPGVMEDAERYPEQWAYQSTSASLETVVCALGDANSGDCQIWYYWARYGQYLLQIRYFGPGLGISAEEFVVIVQDVEKQMGTTFR